jgi:hypothetical protein
MPAGSPVAFTDVVTLAEPKLAVAPTEERLKMRREARSAKEEKLALQL